MSAPLTIEFPTGVALTVAGVAHTGAEVVPEDGQLLSRVAARFQAAAEAYDGGPTLPVEGSRAGWVRVLELLRMVGMPQCDEAATCIRSALGLPEPYDPAAVRAHRKRKAER
ncbi:hypothetical protein [Alienimonas sp. DA493]|uniref:hypothetical protein n=1 Tax=Alienimonas sp. DA493 TaxID=3373605 RepID=UPI0037552F51